MNAPSTRNGDARSQCSQPPHPVQPPPDSSQAAAQLPADGTAGLYVHVPFCFHKCHYCDFYSIVDDSDRQGQFTDRLIDEIQAVADAADRPKLNTIFVGGGTPTLLAPGYWRALLAAIDNVFDLSNLAEFTVEANPETVTGELMHTLAAGGVNRISIGCQSFNPDHLQTLERRHAPGSVVTAVKHARASGIDNINLDLIYAIPGQTLEQWHDDLQRALALGPTHLSCYALTYEPNTPMTVKLRRGRIKRADDDVETAMFEATIDTLCAAGFEHYEVSNFALMSHKRKLMDSHRCLHNMGYWLNRDWLAVGPSASGHVRGMRWKSVAHLGRYLASAGGAPIEADSVEQLDAAASVGEQLMLRLRLIEGVPTDWLAANASPKQMRVIDQHIDQGLLARSGDHIQLTRRGLLIADTVIADLL